MRIALAPFDCLDEDEVSEAKRSTPHSRSQRITQEASPPASGNLDGVKAPALNKRKYVWNRVKRAIARPASP